MSFTVLNQFVVTGLAKQFRLFSSFNWRSVPNIKISIRQGFEFPLMNTESGSWFASFASFALSMASAIWTPTTAIGWSEDVEYVTPRLTVHSTNYAYCLRELYCSASRE